MNCELLIELTSPGDPTCAQGIYSLDQCGKAVKLNEWYHKQPIAVKHKNDINRRAIKSFEVHLQSKVKRGGHLYWDKVKVPTIIVSINA